MLFIKIFLISITVVLGLCVGSFLNVVIYRFPNGMSLAKPGSHCTKCKSSIKWCDNIPVLSYIFLGGKCRKCKQKISFRYLFVELLNGILWFLSLLKFTDLIIPSNTNNYLMFVITCLVASVLICVFYCDYDNMIIPDTFQVILLILGAIGLIDNFSNTYLNKLLGLVVGGEFFFLIWGIYYLVKKKDGLGFGDIKLMAVLGLLLGVNNTILTIFLSAIIGAIVLVIVSFCKKGGKDKEYPFAIFIVPCALFAMFLGEYVVNWYLSLFYLL